MAALVASPVARSTTLGGGGGRKWGSKHRRGQKSAFWRRSKPPATWVQTSTHYHQIADSSATFTVKSGLVAGERLTNLSQKQRAPRGENGVKISIVVLSVFSPICFPLACNGVGNGMCHNTLPN